MDLSSSPNSAITARCAHFTIRFCYIPPASTSSQYLSWLACRRNYRLEGTTKRFKKGLSDLINVKLTMQAGQPKITLTSFKLRMLSKMDVISASIANHKWKQHFLKLCLWLVLHFLCCSSSPEYSHLMNCHSYGILVRHLLLPRSCLMFCNAFYSSSESHHTIAKPSNKAVRYQRSGDWRSTILTLHLAPTTNNHQPLVTTM